MSKNLELSIKRIYMGHEFRPVPHPILKHQYDVCVKPNELRYSKEGQLLCLSFKSDSGGDECSLSKMTLDFARDRVKNGKMKKGYIVYIDRPFPECTDYELFNLLGKYTINETFDLLNGAVPLEGTKFKWKGKPTLYYWMNPATGEPNPKHLNLDEPFEDYDL